MKPSNSTSLNRDVLTYFASKLAPAIIMSGAVVVFIRLLGPAEFAVMSLVLALARAIAAFSSSWLAQSVLRYFPAFSAHPKELGRLVWKGLKITLAVVAVLIGPVLYLGAGHIASVEVLVAAAAYIFLQILFLVLLALFQASQRPELFLRAELLRSIVFIVFSVSLCWLIDNSAEMVILGHGLSVGLAAAYCSVRRNRVGSFFETGNRALGDRADSVKGISLATFANFGLPMSVWLGITVSFEFVDRLILIQLTGAESTAPFAAAQELVYRGLAFLLLPVTLAVHPRIMAAFERSEPKSVSVLMSRALRLNAMIAVPVLIASVLLTPVVARVVDVPTSSLSGLLMPLAATAAVWQAGQLVHKPLEMYGRTKTMVVCAGVALSVSVVISLILVPHYGSLAVAYSGLARAILYALLVMGLSRAVLNLNAEQVGDNTMP